MTSEIPAGRRWLRSSLIRKYLKTFRLKTSMRHISAYRDHLARTISMSRCREKKALKSAATEYIAAISVPDSAYLTYRTHTISRRSDILFRRIRQTKSIRSFRDRSWQSRKMLLSMTADTFISRRTETACIF
ncbi:MAG: hypothetical protein IKE48_01985 [Parasporobacterium sp.]|nr:hypothetical protein [Parasporobacterium sp.]